MRKQRRTSTFKCAQTSTIANITSQTTSSTNLIKREFTLAQNAGGSALIPIPHTEQSLTEEWCAEVAA